MSDIITHTRFKASLEQYTPCKGRAMQARDAAEKLLGPHAGGCQLSLQGDKLYLYSGHTVVVDKADQTETEVVHDDLWSLDLTTFTVCMPSTQAL